MPTLGVPAGTAVEEDLVLPIPGRDGTITEYRIAPCTAGELFDLMALDALWEAIGRQRFIRLSDPTSAQVAKETTPDKALQQRIQRLMDGEMTAEDMLALPLGPVADQMLADGVAKGHYLLASMTAMYWHLAGDDVAKEIWTTGSLPGKPAARRKKNSTSTGTGGPRRAASRDTGSRRK